nr:MAG TPA: hypothetical protein [Caudoviricetes sp.]
MGRKRTFIIIKKIYAKGQKSLILIKIIPYRIKNALPLQP